MVAKISLTEERVSVKKGSERKKKYLKEDKFKNNYCIYRHFRIKINLRWHDTFNFYSFNFDNYLSF